MSSSAYSPDKRFKYSTPSNLANTMSGSQNVSDSLLKEEFSKLFKEGVHHVQETNRQFNSDNALLEEISDKVAVTGTTVWNWYRGNSIPRQSTDVGIVLAFHSLTEKEPLSEDWYANLLRDMGRRKHDIDYYRNRYREIVGKHQLPAKMPSVDAAASTHALNHEPESSPQADQIASQTPERKRVATKLIDGISTRLTLTIALGWWLVVGVLPLLALTIEFGTDYGLYFARLYPHLFLQPLFFGFFLGIVTAVMIQVFRRYEVLKLYMFIAIGCSILVTPFEVSSGDIAIWETKPTVGYLSSMNNQRTQGENFQFLLTNCSSKLEAKTADECKNIQAEIDPRLKEHALSIRNSSITRWFYAMAIFIYIAAIGLLTLFTIFLQMKKATLAQDEGSFENLGMICGWGLIAISLWFPLRLASTILKERIYIAPNLMSTILIMALFVLVCVVFFFNYGTRYSSWFTAFAIFVLAASMAIFFIQPNFLVSQLIGDLEHISLTQNLGELIPTFMYQFVAFLVLSIQLLLAWLNGDMRFWREDQP